MNLPLETKKFRSQHKLFSENQVQESTTNLVDVINKEEISIDNINEITEKIVFILQNGTDINNILQKNAIQKIIQNYQDYIMNYLKNKNELSLQNKIDPFFKLINEISIYSDEKIQAIAQTSQIPQLLISILQSTKEEDILTSTAKSICNLIYKKPLTSSLFYDNKFIEFLYKCYNSFFFMNRYSNLTIYQVFQLFELLIILVFTYPIQNKEIYDKYYLQLFFSIKSILEKKRCEENNDIFIHQIDFLASQLLDIFENFDLSYYQNFLTSDFLNSLLKNIEIGGEITKNILKIFDILSTLFPVAFFMLTNDNFRDFHPDINDIEVFQIYCSICKKMINTFTDVGNNYPIGKKQHILKLIEKVIPNLFQYFHLVDQIIENQKVLNLTFIGFTYFDDKKIIECVLNEIPNMIEGMSSQKAEIISKGFLNIIQHYKYSEIIQRIINKDINKKYIENIFEKLKVLQNEKVTQLHNNFTIIEPPPEKANDNNDNDKSSIQVDDIEDEISKYINEKKRIYSFLLKYIEKSNDIHFAYLINEIEKQKIDQNQSEFELFLKMVTNIANNHYRGTNFIKKITEIINKYKNQIKQTFSNSKIFNIFKTNKMILLFLIENKIITIDENIYNEMKQMNYCQFFYPEIESFISNDNSKQTVDNTKRHTGENDSYICSLIRKDSVDEFIAYVNNIKNNVNLKSYKIDSSIYETNSFLIEKEKTSLIEYSAFYGSIQIFQYLVFNNIELKPSIWLYAIHSKNPDMIHILENHHVLPDDKTYHNCLMEAIKCHHNDIANYIEDNLLIEKDKMLYQYQNKKSLFSSIYKNYNFSFIQNDDLSFLNLCQYNYLQLVKLLIKAKNLNINVKLGILI